MRIAAVQCVAVEVVCVFGDLVGREELVWGRCDSIFSVRFGSGRSCRAVAELRPSPATYLFGRV